MAKKVLMIDDQVGITAVVGFVARKLGMEFKAIHSSLAAVEVFVEYRPDILIIDMIMPEKDGLDVLNEILTTGNPDASRAHVWFRRWLPATGHWPCCVSWDPGIYSEQAISAYRTD